MRTAEESATGAAAIGIDVGGTKVAAVVVDSIGRVTESGRALLRPEPRRPGQVLVPLTVEQVEAAMEEVLREIDLVGVVGVGLSLAALVDPAGRRVDFATHLPWRHDDVAARLEERWGRPVTLGNDANCAAVAEHRLGAARGSSSALLITVGTGIGGAFLIEGKPWSGHTGAAGEFGHMLVEPNGLTCECGMAGCWEQYASGNALERLHRMQLGSHLSGPEVAARAHAGDRHARSAFEAVGTWLGRGIGGLVSALDPEVVVVGGGVADVGELLLEPAREAMVRSVHGAAWRRLPPLLPAELGGDAGAVGAALLALDAAGRRR